MSLEIRYVLKHCKMPRYEIAKRLDINVCTLRDWERGYVRFREHMLVDICTVTGFDVVRIPPGIRARAKCSYDVELPGPCDPPKYANQLAGYAKAIETRLKKKVLEKERVNKLLEGLL